MIAGFIALAAGCAAPQEQNPTTNVTMPAQPAAGQPNPRDAKPTAQQVFALQIFQLAVPVGSISSNADFWKPFDETFLDLWMHDVLYKNGLRVGRAPLHELEAIQGQLDDAERTDQALIGVKGQNIEMPLEGGVEHEILFAFDRFGRSAGRDFYQVDNFFMFGFRQVPRRPDHVRLEIAPAVRDQKRKLTLDETGQPKWEQPISIYEVGITTELGLDQCLVISPSDVALTTSTSVGRVFMMEDRPAARVERVLVIVPRLVGSLEEVQRNSPLGPRR